MSIPMKTLTIGEKTYEIVDETARAAINESAMYVTPEMFGAVGDGETDDYEAFQRAFDSGLPIVCKGGKEYYVGRTINARDKHKIYFDGSGSRFANFHVEIWLSDDSYTNRGGTSSMWDCAYFTNMNIGAKGWCELDENPYVPTIVSGMCVFCENIVMRGHFPLVAYTHTYLDKLVLKNVTYSTGLLEEDDSYLDAITATACVMYVTSDGVYEKYNSEASGDGWIFENVNEAKSPPSGNGERFGLVSLHCQNSATFISCIQIYVWVGYSTMANFYSCHFEENAGVAFYSATSDTMNQANFYGCFFYGRSTYPLVKKAHYHGCNIEIRHDISAGEFTHGVSLLSEADIHNCHIGYENNVSSADKQLRIQPNYLSLYTYCSLTVGTRDKSDSVNNWPEGSYSIAAYMITVDSQNVYSKVAELETTLNGTQAILVTATNPIPCKIKVYVTDPNGNIYASEISITEPLISVNYEIFRDYTQVSEGGVNRRDNYPNADVLPHIDTNVKVEKIPTFTERSDLFMVSEDLYVSTSDTEISESKLMRVASGAISQGSGF